MTEPIEIITLHVPRSPDARTEFGRVADILDHLATTYGWHPDVFGFLVSRASEARNMDRVYREREKLRP